MQPSPKVNVVSHTATDDAKAFERSQGFFLSSADNTCVLVRTVFRSYEGSTDESPCLRLGLNLGNRHLVTHRSNATYPQVDWPCGSILTWSGEQAHIRTPEVDILGLSIDLVSFSERSQMNFRPEDFYSNTQQALFEKEIASTLIALWKGAEIHNSSTAIFEYGTLKILSRLSNSKQSPVPKRRRPLDSKSVKTIDDIIESEIFADISATRMAEELQMDVTSFSKAFVLATGTTPFAYLTVKRMLRAYEFLLQGISVTETALAVGYQNPSKFSAAFRKTMGLPASALHTK